MPEKRYTKVEEEVIQILDRLESEKPSGSRPNLRLVESPRSRKQPSRWKSIKPSFNLSRVVAGRPWIWIAASIGLAFVALLVRDTSENLALALALASIVAFFAPIFVNRRGSGSYGSSSSPGEVKQWRGRDISFDPPDGPSPAERLSRWFQDRRRGGPRL
ncbi:MAG TPA: hypothetical protein VFV93_00830 [Thermomicrobiales bacterium]|nr:hypothetical protein [Thermomicrobiales bacterium]